MQCLRLLTVSVTLALAAIYPPANAADDNVATPRIVGGMDAPVNRWPWMAQLAITDPNLTGGYLLCGASQLSTRWLLTAAHCMEYPNGDPVPASNVYAFIGDTDRNNVPATGIQAQQVLVHRQYRNLNHDLALVRIPARNNSQWPSIIPLEDYLRLEAAPFEQRDEAVTALGWGETGNGLSNDLQEVQLDYLPRSLCRELSGLTISDFVICAAEQNPVSGNNQDTCFGDSGGPLFLGRDRSPWVAGITSFGERNCATGAPGGYTHLAAETGELETLTASAGFPLLDLELLWSSTPPARFYNAPDSSRNLTMTLKNNSASAISNPTLSYSLSGGVIATAQWSNCSGGLLSGNRCSPVSSLSGSRNQSLILYGNNGQNQVITVTVQGTADQEDYRRRNNTLQQVVVFSNNPDIALSVRQTSRTTNRAIVAATLSNLSTLNPASGTALLFTLPTGMSLNNAATLGCTGTSPIRCPLGDLAMESSKTLNLQIDSNNGTSRSLTFQATLNEQDVPAGDTTQTQTISYSPAPTVAPSSGSSGGPWWPGMLALLGTLALRRRPCSPP